LEHVPLSQPRAVDPARLILVYFPIGIPIHVITIVNGNTDHYAVFPGWYSFAILPAMLAMIVFFARLRNADREEDDEIGR
jgi:hypothetical protein